MKQVEQIYQQGDVILKRRSSLPKELKALKPKPRGWVVAEGEATGHAHVLDRTADLEAYEDAEGTIWLKVNEPVEMKHEEHHTQVIEPGVYERGIVREVDPFTEEIREVQD